MVHVDVVPVGALACQQDSFCKELSTFVVHCTPVEDAFEVLLQDTILFPEGGGQPCDLGWIADVEVTNVQRRGQNAVHSTKCPLQPGDQVTVKLDWGRRLDHMQQHSAQHLITAMADAEFGLHTEAWHLGERTSYIQFNASEITTDQLAMLEKKVNTLILDQRPVNIILSNDAQHDPRIRSRGLPADMTGPIRVVDIQGVDQNLCCGTHVSNLGQLQAIKLLYAEPHKKSCLLHFVAGGRLVDTFGAVFDRERAVTKAFGGLPPEKHATTVETMRRDATKLTKANKTLLLEVAEYVAKDLVTSMNPADYTKSPFFFHRDDATVDFLNVIADKLMASYPSLLVVLTCGAPKDDDLQFLVSGPAAVVADAGPKVATILEGKGNGSGGKYRGKSSNGKTLKLLKKQLVLNSGFVPW